MRFTAKFTAPVLTAASIAISASSSTAVAQQPLHYLGQVMMVGFNFCPQGWVEANGQLLPISQYSALYSLLGLRYGGDGKTTFGVPDLRGRSPVGVGDPKDLEAVKLGEMGGSQSFQLTTNQMPSHSHAIVGSTTAATDPNPNGATLGQSTIYVPGIPSANLNSASIGSTGGTQTISKQSPFLGLKICICFAGVYPSRS